MTQPPDDQPPTERAPYNGPPQPPQPGPPYQGQQPYQGQPYQAPPPGQGQPPNPYGGYPSPYQPPKGGSGKTIAIVVGIIVVVILAICGGIVGLAVWGLNTVEDSIDEFDGDRRGGPNNPITLVEGEAFEIDGIEYDEGWTIAPPADEYNGNAIVGLMGENDRSDGSSETVSLRFTFLTGNSEVGEIACHSNGSISHGNTEELECSDRDTLPAYDSIEVSASY